MTLQVIVGPWQHMLREVGPAGRTVHAVCRLLVSTFYRRSRAQRREAIEQKRRSLESALPLPKAQLCITQVALGHGPVRAGSAFPPK